MADDVQISVGITLDRLNEGVNSAKDSLETLKRGFEGLASVVGVSLTIEGIKSFVESMAELGHQAETVQAQLGITTGQFVQLGGLAKLGGIEVGTLALGMERMTLNIQRSTRDGLNPAAQALKQLGLNAQEFTKLDATAQFQRLTQAVSNFNPSLNLTNALMLIGGRSAGQLVAVLRGAGLGWDEFNSRVKAASVGLAEAIPGMAETNSHISILQLSVQSLGARIFNALKPAIDWAINGMTQWAQSLTDKKIESALKSIGDVTLEIVRVIGAMVIKVIQLIRDLKAELGGVDWNKVGAAAAFGAGGGALIGQPIAGAAIGAGIAMLSQFGDASKQVEQNARDADAQLKSFNDTVVNLRNNMPALSGEVATFSSRFSQILPFGQQVNEFNNDMTKFTQTLANFKMPKDFGALNFDAAGKMREQLKVTDDYYAKLQTDIKGQLATYQITQGQETALLKQALQDRYDAEVAAGQKVGEAWAKEQKDLAKIEEEAAKKATEQWKGVADSLASNFSSALDSVLTKQESFGQAMTRMFAKMIEEMIANLIKLLVEYTLLNAVAGTALAPNLKAPTLGGLAGGISPILGGLLGGGGAGQTAALTANTTALTALTTAVTGHAAVTATDTAVTATDTAATTGQTIATTGNTVAQSGTAAAWLANTLATTANTIATWAKSFIPGAATGLWNVGSPGAFPSYAAGTVGVPGTQLALLHAGEMVIPAAPAAQIRDNAAALGSVGLGGGNQNISLNINALDGRSVANMFFNNRQFMQQLINTLARNNPSNASRLAGVV